MRNRYRYIAVGLLSTAMMSIGSALAWADDGSIVLDLVRHGESIDNAKGIIDTGPPGTALTKEINMSPLDPSHILSGLNEIPAGSFEGDSTTGLEGILYLLGPLSWVFGDVLMPDIGDPSVNG